VPLPRYSAFAVASSKLWAIAASRMNKAESTTGLIVSTLSEYRGDMIGARTMKQLLTIAQAARSAIQRYVSNTNDLMFKGFPRGTCGPASELLGRYLIEAGFEEVMYVCGEKGGQGSHAWVEIGGVVLDMTGDQFGQPPVVVAIGSWTTTAERPRAPRTSLDSIQIQDQHPIGYRLDRARRCRRSNGYAPAPFRGTVDRCAISAISRRAHEFWAAKYLSVFTFADHMKRKGWVAVL
jgi:hypothetical protein